MKLGGIEAGGTKMVCAIGDEQGNIFDRAVFPTEPPEITVPKMIEYFQDKGIEALGIGCFGPVDLNRKSATYGYITSTPKLASSGASSRRLCSLFIRRAPPFWESFMGK